MSSSESFAVRAAQCNQNDNDKNSNSREHEKYRIAGPIIPLMPSPDTGRVVLHGRYHPLHPCRLNGNARLSTDFQVRGLPVQLRLFSRAVRSR